MDPLQLVQLPALMSRSQGRPEIAVALIDGPIALDHPDFSQSKIKNCCWHWRHLLASAKHRVHSRNLRSGHLGSAPRFLRSSYLSRLQPALASDFSRRHKRERRHAQRNSRRARLSNYGCHRRRRHGDQSQRCPLTTIIARRTPIGTGARLRREAWGPGGSCGWQPGNGRQFRDHSSSRGDRCYRLRS